MHGFQLQARIGINTGTVIAGKVGGDVHMEYTVIGDTVNMASRLEKACEPGKILVSVTTYQRARPIFKFRALPPFVVKGKPRPMVAYEPLYPRKKTGNLRGLPGLQVSMIGREAELKALTAQFKEVLHNHESRIAFIMGEAGVGKSRLRTEFRSEISRLGGSLQIYEGNCLSYTQSRSYWLIAELLRDIIGTNENLPINQQYSNLVTYLEELGAAFQEYLPYYMHVLGIGSADRTIQEKLDRYDATMLHKYTQHAISELLIAEASITPTVLFVEDIHWIDDASRILLQSLLQTTSNVPLYFVIIFRDTDNNLRHQLNSAVELQNEGRVLEIELEALSPEETNQLINQLINIDPNEGNLLSKKIRDMAEGNPFYIEEIVRMLIENEGVRPQNGKWQMSPQVAGLLDQVPGTLQGLIMARFDRLSRYTRRTLQKASVLGVAFPLSLLQILSGGANSAVASQLREIVTRKFLMNRAFGDEIGYVFRHSLMQQAIYSTLLKRDRQDLHEMAAEAIAQSDLWLPTERSEMLAYHYARSKEPSLAIPHLVKSAENAGKSYANTTAVQRYQEVLRLIDKEATEKGEAYYKAKIGLARSLMLLGSYRQARQTLNDTMYGMLRWSLSVDATKQMPILIQGLIELSDLELRASNYEAAMSHIDAGFQAIGTNGQQEFTPLWRSLLAHQAMIYFRQGQLEQAYSIAFSATIPIDSDDEIDGATLANLYYTLAGISWQQGEMPNAIDYAEQCLTIYQNLGYAWGITNAYNSVALLRAQLGQWEEAIQGWEEALAMISDTGDKSKEALYFSNLGVMAMRMGRNRAAKKHLETSFAIHEQLGDIARKAISRMNLAKVARRDNELEKAWQYMQSSKEWVDGLNNKMFQALIRNEYGLTALLTGRKLEAKTAIEQSLRLVEEANLVDLKVEAHRIWGLLQLDAGNFDEAEEAIQISIAMYPKINDPYRYGLGMLALGQVYIAQPKRKNEARQALQLAAKEFEKLGAEYDLRQATSLLDNFPPTVTNITNTDSLVSESFVRQKVTEARLSATILWLQITPPEKMDAELIFERMAEIMPASSGILQTFTPVIYPQNQSLHAIFDIGKKAGETTQQAMLAASQVFAYLKGLQDFQFAFQLIIFEGEVSPRHQDGAVEYTLSGKDFQQVKTLLPHSPVGIVSITDRIRKSTDSFFAYESLGGDLWKIVDSKMPASAPNEIIRPPARPLIGLQEELHTLLNHIEQKNKQSVGSTMTLRGEMGLGKTRLIKALATRLKATKISPFIWRATGKPEEQFMPFSMWKTIFQRAFAIQPDDTPRQKQSKIKQKLGEWQLTTYQFSTTVEFLVEANRDAFITELKPDQWQKQFFVTIRSLLKNICAQQPVILMLDAIEWADSMTVQLIEFVSTLTFSHPLFLLYGLDAANKIEQITNLSKKSNLNIELKPLTFLESQELVGSLMPALSPTHPLTDKLITLAKGNPYFLKKSVAWLEEQGNLNELNPNLLPVSIKDLHQARFALLPPQAQQLVQMGALFGTEFSYDLIKEIFGLNKNAGIEQVLVKQDIWRHNSQRETWEIADTQFVQAVQNSLRPKAKRTLSEKIANGLSTHAKTGEQISEQILAHHFQNANDIPAATHHFIEAAEHALRQNANHIAKKLFQTADELQKKLPYPDEDNQWHIAIGLGKSFQRLNQSDAAVKSLRQVGPLASTGHLKRGRMATLYLHLGQATQVQTEYEASINYLVTAKQLLLEEQDTLDHNTLIKVNNALAQVYIQTGRLELALDACRASLALARTTNFLNARAHVEEIMGKIYTKIGKWDEAIQHWHNVLKIYERLDYACGMSDAQKTLGQVSKLQGDWQKAIGWWKTCLTQRQEIGDWQGEAEVQMLLAETALQQQDFTLAENYYKRSIRLSRLVGAETVTLFAFAGLAQVLAWQGRLAEGERLLTGTMGKVDGMKMPALKATFLITLAQIRLHQYRYLDAIELAQRGVTLAETNTEKPLVLAGWRIATAAAIAHQMPDQARIFLENSQTVASQQHDSLEFALLLRQAQQLMHLVNQPQQANAAQKKADEIFQRLGANLYMPSPSHL
jgi:predicted ATPase